MAYLTYNPATSPYPIRRFDTPNAVKSPDVPLPGFRYWRIIYNQYLVEIQIDLNGSPLRINTTNGVESSTLPASLTDNNIVSGHVGTNNSTTFVTYFLQGFDRLNIRDFWIAPQNQSAVGAIYNPCRTFRVSHSDDNSTWSDDGFGTIQVTDPALDNTINPPYTGTILRPQQLVKVGYS